MKVVTLKAHAIHRLLLFYSLAFFSAALWTDVIYIASSTPWIARVAYLFLSAGVLTAVPTVVAGWVDWNWIPKERFEKRPALYESISETVLLVAYGVSWAFRLPHFENPNYLALTYAFGGAITLVVTAHLAEKLSVLLLWDPPQPAKPAVPFQRAKLTHFSDRQVA